MVGHRRRRVKMGDSEGGVKYVTDRTTKSDSKISRFISFHSALFAPVKNSNTKLMVMSSVYNVG